MNMSTTMPKTDQMPTAWLHNKACMQCLSWDCVSPLYTDHTSDVCCNYTAQMPLLQPSLHALPFCSAMILTQLAHNAG